jgi:uncharacterized protein (TIGR03435 family)
MSSRQMYKATFLLGIALSCLGADALRFDVASIHPHAPDDPRFRVRMPTNGRFTATGSVAKLLVMIAYDVQETQIVGGPGWFATQKWDIEAKRDDRDPHSSEDTLRMLQNLLADRFAMQIHRETAPLQAYILTVAKGGPKFKASGPEGATNFRIAGNSIQLERAGLARLTQLLSGALGRPVVDRTGLDGVYNLSLQWDDAPVPEGGVLGVDAPAAPGTQHGSIFTSIQDQLGLRLDSERTPVEVIVVDRLERPSAN